MALWLTSTGSKRGGVLIGTRARIVYFVVPFLAGMGTVVASVGLLAPRFLLPTALASDPESCLSTYGSQGDDDYGQIWADEDDGSTSDDLRGIRSDVYIVTGAQCQRISSVTVQSPSRNGEFEFGFIRGWWGPSACDGVDHDHFYTQPTLFNVQIQDGSGYDCKFWPNKHPTEEQYDLFRSSDINGNSYWGCYWDGEQLQPDGVDMDFNRGHGVVNMERGSPNDGGHAEFLDIEEYHDGNGWTYIESPSVEFDVDPDFVMDFPTNHSANVHD